MSKNSVKTILITLYLSAVQDPEPLLKYQKTQMNLDTNGHFIAKIKYQFRCARYVT